jgi:hypothetical protein
MAATSSTGATFGRRVATRVARVNRDRERISRPARIPSGWRGGDEALLGADLIEEYDPDYERRLFAPHAQAVIDEVASAIRFRV